MGEHRIRIGHRPVCDPITYAWARCECLDPGEILIIQRSNSNEYIRFDCPRCGTRRGLAISSVSEVSQKFGTLYF
jgi:hypothetical protein